MKQDSIRSPLGRARGLGTAKDGTHHWWMQRVTAVALLPVCIYLIFAAHEFLPAPDHYMALLAALSNPVTAIAVILGVIAGFYHAALGVQVIIEDYIHGDGCKIALLLFNKIAFFFLGTACLYAVAFINFALVKG